MRKDYIQASGKDLMDETEFVAAHWTEVWQREGGPQGRAKKIRRQDEYLKIQPYFRDLPPGARMFDGGCGLGDWVLALADDGYRTVGLDLSERTIEQLHEKYPDREFRAGDIRATGFGDQEFDAYLSWGVFEHFEAGPQDCLKEAFRILKPGGLLFISVPLDNLRQSIKGTFAAPHPGVAGDRFYQYRFTRTELARELSIAGFELIKLYPIHKRQGILRSLHHEFGLPYGWLLTRALSVALLPFLPGWWIAHMMLAVARKPAG